MLKSAFLVLFSTAVVAMVSAANAQTIITNSVFASVRAPAGDVDEAVVGYVRVAYADPVSTTAAKGYFQFNLTGYNPNTNADFTFNFVRYYNNGQTRIKLWVLDQDYAGMTQTIGWDIAQANNITNNDLLTSGGFTATLLDERFISPSGGSVARPYTYTLSAPWGQYVHNNHLTLAMSAVFDANNDSARFRVSILPSPHAGATNAPPTLGFTNITSGTPPTISLLTNINGFLPPQYVPATNYFTVADADTGTTGLNPVATSSDTNVVANGNIFISGSGGNYSVYALPTGPGTTRITVSVLDLDNNPANRSFTVTAVEPSPTLSRPPNTNTLNTASVTFPFTVSDNSTPVGSLVVSGQVASVSASLVSSVVAGGSGANRTLTVTPTVGAQGVAVVNAYVADTDGLVSTTNFAVMIHPANLRFVDNFDYADDPGEIYGQMYEQSAAYWDIRSSGVLKLRNQYSGALIRSSSAGEDLIAQLNAPVGTGSGTVLYYGFRFRCEAPPGQSQYFIHFYDSSTLAQIGRVYIMPGSSMASPPADTNQFTLGVANATQPTFSGIGTIALSTNTVYRVVLRYNVDNPTGDTTKIWVNAAAEADPAFAEANDILAAVGLTQIGLRQDVNMGVTLLDSLKVGTNFSDVLPVISTPTTPVITGIRFTAADTLQIDFTAGSSDSAAQFSLVRATQVDFTYDPVSATITQLSPGVFRAVRTFTPGTQGYYRIARLGL